MNFHVLTLFPEMIEQGVNTSITGRAINNGLRNVLHKKNAAHHGNILPL